MRGPGREVRCFTARYAAHTPVLFTEVWMEQHRPGLTGQTEGPKGPTLTAVWDTGATGTVITQGVVDRLGLRPIGVARIATAGGERETAVYLVSLFLPNRVMLPSIEVCVGEIRGADVLIGMSIIGSGDFAVTQEDGKTVMSFRMPSVACIDFTVPPGPQAGPEKAQGLPRNEAGPSGSEGPHRRSRRKK